jgi:hypothetical protein
MGTYVIEEGFASAVVVVVVVVKDAVEGTVAEGVVEPP